MEQLVARRAHNPKVVGSSPAPATEALRFYLRAFFMTKFSEQLVARRAHIRW